MAALLTAASSAAAGPVPLPRERPAALNDRFGVAPPSLPSSSAITALAPAPELQDIAPPLTGLAPSACELRLSEIAAFASISPLAGPGECGATDVVRLESVTMPDNRTQVALNPPATLRCSMAEAVAHWVRQDVGPAAATLGAPLASIVNYDSYDCRGRNRIRGAKLSEHGRANAIDVRAIRLANGTVVELTSPIVAKDFRERLRAATCGRFNTVLGPGSDGYHESHIHMDLAERVRAYRMCQWDVREPPVLVEVPLPVPRPAALAKPNDDETSD